MASYFDMTMATACPTHPNMLAMSQPAHCNARIWLPYEMDCLSGDLRRR